MVFRVASRGKRACGPLQSSRHPLSQKAILAQRPKARLDVRLPVRALPLLTATNALSFRIFSSATSTTPPLSSSGAFNQESVV